MKKYSCLLFVVNFLSVYCMELQRPQLFEAVYDTTTNNSLVNYQHDTYSHHDIHPPTFSIPLQVNEPGWQQLNAIANMTYKREEPITKVAGYNTSWVKETNTFKEEKPSDSMLMEKLYNDVSNLSGLSTIITLITEMNKARSNTINEDSMGRYANALDYWFRRGRPTEIAVIFGYLKHYNLTVNCTKECLPSVEDLVTKKPIKKTSNQLLQTLGLSSIVDTNITHTTNYDPDVARHKYPAFVQLMSGLMDSDKNLSNLRVFLSYIYSDKEIPQNKYAQLSYTDLQEKFYNEVLNLFRQGYSQCNIDESSYDLVQIIEAVKALDSSKKEDDFGYDIIEAKKTTIIRALIAVINEYAHDTRKRLGILCHYIKKYNNQRAAKITPTKKQYKSYKNLPIDFALPNSFDSTLFDRKIYAFDEFETLIDDIRTLKHSSEENVQECFDQLYPAGNQS